MNSLDPLTCEPDNSWAQRFTTQQLIDSHNHLVSVGMPNSNAVRLLRDEINLRARIACKLRAQGVALDNFDPNELRDWHGRWTDGNVTGTFATNPNQVPGNKSGILARIESVLQKFGEKIRDTVTDHSTPLERGNEPHPFGIEIPRSFGELVNRAIHHPFAGMEVLGKLSQ